MTEIEFSMDYKRAGSAQEAAEYYLPALRMPERYRHLEELAHLELGRGSPQGEWDLLLAWAFDPEAEILLVSSTMGHWHLLDCPEDFLRVSLGFHLRRIGAQDLGHLSGPACQALWPERCGFLEGAWA